MKVFFFNKKSMVWVVLLVIIIVIVIALMTCNATEPTGIIKECIMELV